MIDIRIRTWWQFTVVGILIAVGFIINMFGVDNKRERIGFVYNVMPKLRPLKIMTQAKDFGVHSCGKQRKTLEVANNENQKRTIIPQGFRMQ